MASTKIAVSLAPSVLREANRLARARRKSRSGFIAELIMQAASETRDRDIVARLDRVYGRPDVRREQARMTRERYQGEVFGDDSEW